MTKDRSPPMLPLFVGDFVKATRLLSLAERGALVDLWCFQWELGVLPSAPERLARLIGASSAEFSKVWTGISEFFTSIEDGLISPEIEAHRAKALGILERRTQIARQAARERWGEHTEAEGTASAETTEGAPPAPARAKKSPSEELTEPAPEGLDPAAWQRWETYRRQIKKTIKAPSLRAAQRQLAKHGADQAAVVEHSIANGYTGLFAPKSNGAAPRTPYRSISTAELEAQEAAREEANADAER